MHGAPQHVVLTTLLNAGLYDRDHTLRTDFDPEEERVRKVQARDKWKVLRSNLKHSAKVFKEVLQERANAKESTERVSARECAATDCATKHFFLAFRMARRWVVLTSRHSGKDCVSNRRP